MMREVNKQKSIFLVGALSLSAIGLLITIQTCFMDPAIDPAATEVSQVEVTLMDSSVERLLGMKRRLPHAIIIGARKSGTRALARFLEINPAIRSAHNEVHFFDRPNHYQLGLDWYRKQMPLTSRDQLTIEKSPAYLVTDGVAGRIRAMNASIKLIVIMRDPITRLVSDFSQLLANRMKFGFNASEGEDQEADSLDDDPLDATNQTGKIVDLQKAEEELRTHVLRPDGGIDDQRRIVRIGMYSLHLERWLSMFSRNQMYFVDGERLIKEPHVELQKLELFLGFNEPKIMKEHFVYSAKKGFYCMVDTGSARDKRQVEFVEMLDKYKFRKPICLGKSKGRKHVPIGRELSEKLRNFYAPYNEYLLSMTGLNFT